MEAARRCSGRLQRHNSSSFSFLVYKQEPKRFSKRSRSLFHAPTTDVDGAARSFYFCRFIGCRGRKDEGPSLSWEGTMRFLSTWTEELGQKKEEGRKREREEEEAPFHLETATKNIEPFRSLPLLSQDPRSSDTQEVHFDIVRKLSNVLVKSCRLHW